jgi:glycosyltransferase involved in cell wall biosynthesis
MSVLYLVTSLEPVLPGTDAVFQDVSLLCANFNGEMINLHPEHHVPRYPRLLFGLGKFALLKSAENRHQVTHVFCAEPYLFPILRCLRNPLYYTVTAGLNANAKPRSLDRLSKRARLVVSNKRDVALLQSWGHTPAAMIGPTVDKSHFSVCPLPLNNKLTLLMASAPWVAEQFELKGIDILLDTVKALHFLKLILVWRGLLYDELVRRVRSRGISDRVEIVNGPVNISDYLARSHAAILIAKRPDQIKAYPHSLLESLAAGKPVVLSATIPMADFVRDNCCGVVIEEINIFTMIKAIRSVMEHYADLADNAESLNLETFSVSRMLEMHKKLYEDHTHVGSKSEVRV